jgi:hypothetical protein
VINADVPASLIWRPSFGALYNWVAKRRAALLLYWQKVNTMRTNDSIAASIARNVKQLNEARNLSQEQSARLSDVPRHMGES